MNLKRTLTITSLLSGLLASFHLSDDIVRGIEPGGTSNYTGVLILAVYLYATLMLAERRWAHLIVLIGSATSCRPATRWFVSTPGSEAPVRTVEASNVRMSKLASCVLCVSGSSTLARSRLSARDSPLK